MLSQLQSAAGPKTVFHGTVDDETLRELIEGCSTLCFPGSEDFGIVPVEANAAGKPVVAHAARGACETVEDGVTGVLFEQQSVEAVMDAIRAADDLPTEPAKIARHAERFSVDAFRSNFRAALESALTDSS